MPSLNIWVIVGLGLAIIGTLSGAYYFIYKQGASSEIVKQERALNELKDRTDAVQDRALTTSHPNDELRKFARPD